MCNNTYEDQFLVGAGVNKDPWHESDARKDQRPWEMRIGIICAEADLEMLAFLYFLITDVARATEAVVKERGYPASAKVSIEKIAFLKEPEFPVHESWREKVVPHAEIKAGMKNNDFDVVIFFHANGGISFCGVPAPEGGKTKFELQTGVKYKYLSPEDVRNAENRRP